MPLYDYCCPQGHLFEQMATIAERARQNCPTCGRVSEKIPSRVSLAGRADPGPSMEQMPQTWRGTYEGNPEYPGQLRRHWGARRKLEDKYEELRISAARSPAQGEARLIPAGHSVSEISTKEAPLHSRPPRAQSASRRTKITTHAETVVHEGAHALVGLVTGRRILSVRINRDGGG